MEGERREQQRGQIFHKASPSSALGAVRARGPTASDWSPDVDRTPHAQAHQGLTGATEGRDWCQRWEGWGSFPWRVLTWSWRPWLELSIHGPGKVGTLSLPMLGLAEPCRDTDVWKEEELRTALMWSPGL